MSLSRALSTRARAKRRVTDEDELYQTSCIKKFRSPSHQPNQSNRNVTEPSLSTRSIFFAGGDGDGDGAPPGDSDANRALARSIAFFVAAVTGSALFKSLSTAGNSPNFNASSLPLVSSHLSTSDPSDTETISVASPVVALGCFGPFCTRTPISIPPLPTFNFKCRLFA